MNIEESVMTDETIYPDEISLDSFEAKDELNPKFWVGGKLKTNVRIRLLDIAHDFFEDLDVRWIKPKDVVLTGSLANYNWSKYSDIDLHIIVDFSEVYDKTEFVEDYFNSKKIIWNEAHDTLKIYGFPVEVYVEDYKAPSESSGVYSLVTNKWIKEPKDLSDARFNREYVTLVSAKYMTLIDELVAKYNLCDDKEKLGKLRDLAEKIFHKLRDKRKAGLETKACEMSSGNIIWKLLRREGYLDKVWNLIDDAYNEIHSIS